MGSRDEAEPVKVEGVTTDESNVDDSTQETQPNSDYRNGTDATAASIHLIVDNEPLCVPVVGVAGNNLVKDSYKFIQICDTGTGGDTKPFLNGHIPSSNHAQDKDIPLQQISLIAKEGDAEAAAAAGNGEWRASNSQAFWCLFFLLVANLINYMDRVTIAGVLLEIQKYYGINNSDAGLLQTAFICSYMVLSPIFGYLGDRYNRKMIMACGILFWSIVTLLGSFVPQNRFWAFLLLRGLVGVGEASYSTIAPTIIADIFVKDRRTKALAVFYFAIPIGSGLGYIVGASVAKAFGAWQWALRVTPGLGVLCVLGIIFIVKEPPRGASEGGSHISSTAWATDLKYLCKNKSYLLSSAGFTCVAFVAGALSLWAPAFMQYSIRVQQQYEPDDSVALKFGIITCIAGFLGVGIGSESARRLRVKYPGADPIVCAFGLLACAPFLYLAMILSKFHTIITWVLIFIGETFLCLNWAIVTDIILYIVIPTRRSTASAFQILVSHAFGDAGSPYLIGVVSDSIKRNHVPEVAGEVAANFISLQYSLYMCCFICVIGGGFFLATGLFVGEDRAKADRAIKGTAKAAGDSKRVPSVSRHVTGTSVGREGDGDDSPSVDDATCPRPQPEGAPALDNHLHSVVT